MIKGKKLTPASKGFTLVEVLVVIAIIATLAAVITAVAGSVTKKGKIKESELMASKVAAACDRFYEEYSYFPPTSQASSNTDDEIFSLGDNSKDFLGDLTGDSIKYNIKEKKFLEIQDAKGKSKNAAYGGIFRSGNGDPVALLDSWGNAYQVILDSDLDGKVVLPSTNESVQSRVAIWSAGPDMKLNTEDDIKSW